MPKKQIKILCTLGPSTLNKRFLNFAERKISLLRLNMSHIEIKDLSNIIKFIKKNSNIPICIDTEGSQIRTKVKKLIHYKVNQKFKVKYRGGNFNLYPDEVFQKIRKNDELHIGFDDLKAKVLSKKKIIFFLTQLLEGRLKTIKGYILKIDL